MKLSISNIAWTEENDAAVFSMMTEMGYDGLEIAPTRVFPKAPYSQLLRATAWAAASVFSIPSMQSIWYGQTGNIFNESERESLMEYTRLAIDFAAAIKCRNLVFGCPRNRCIPKPECRPDAVRFFGEIADYAVKRGCIIGIEANPPIYNTNFINTTAEALKIVKEIASPGFMLNLDVGTMVHNHESIEILQYNVAYISHVHISEPYLKLIEKRPIHRQLADLLKQEGYDNYISIEMTKQQRLDEIRQTMAYIKNIFK